MFKVGDKVKLEQYIHWRDHIKHKDEIGVLAKDNGNGEYKIRWADNSTSRVGTGYAKIIKANEDKEVARRTFKLIKDTPELKKGALVQENCDNGDQDYSVLPEFVNSHIKYENEEGEKDVEYARGAVEKEPKFWVEVFKAEPAYLTREELTAYKTFLAKKTKKGHK